MKYICEVNVNKSESDPEISLVNSQQFSTEAQDKGKTGAINFETKKDLHEYLKNHCISDRKLESSGNGFMSFLFVFLFIAMIIGVVSIFTKNMTTLNSVSPTKFGKFSY